MTEGTFERLMDYYPEYYKDLLEINELVRTEANEIKSAKDTLSNFSDEAFIDSATDHGLDRLETIYKIVPPSDASFEERREVLKSQKRGFDKLSSDSIKNITDAFTNGDVIVKFEPSKVLVQFVSVLGIPSNISEVTSYLEVRKPAHLSIEFIFIYRRYEQLKTMTHQQLKEFTHIQIKEEVIG